MSRNSTLYDRMLSYAQAQGIKNTKALADALGFDKPERLYRLKRDADARPSFETLEGLAYLFENLNLRWLITGQGPRELPSFTGVQEPPTVYITRAEERKKLLGEKERVINQQQETITALNEAYSQLKLRFEDCEQKLK